MKSKKLILLTSEFPFGKGETFLESELPFLAAKFEQVIIVSNDMRNNSSIKLPQNCSARRFNLELTKLEKLRSLLGIASSEFKAEKKYVQQHLKLPMNLGIRNTMLVSLFRSKKIKDNLIDVNGSTDFSNTVCYSYWCDDNALGLALLQLEFPEVKTVSRAHGWDLYFEATQFNYLPFRKNIVNGLSEFYPISQKGLDYVVNRWGISKDSVKVKRLGSLGGEYIAIGTKSKVVSCSNLIPLKRVDLIASALCQINDMELEWFHFGDGVEMKKIEAILKNMPSSIKVHFLGRKSNREILNWYKENGPNLFLNVSTTEGIPVSIMEAMSFGIPALATDVGGTSEIVNNKNGALLPVDITAEQLANRIKLFFQSTTESQEEKRRRSLDTWRSMYDAEKNYRAFASDLVEL